MCVMVDFIVEFERLMSCDFNVFLLNSCTHHVCCNVELGQISLVLVCGYGRLAFVSCWNDSGGGWEALSLKFKTKVV